MKILDRYILITYLKTFISVFIILMFIFVLQTIWLYISELAGKDLDVWIILKFLWYVSPRLIPLVLPLTILVTSLMVFGNFSEKYEFAAMKSTGISLQRAMRSLMVFIGILALTTFLFANNVIPYSEYKWQNLRRNISQFKPSMAIVEGQFNQVGDNFNIKVDRKSGDRDQYLDGVIIHEKKPSHPSGNYTVSISETGELASEEGTNTLSLILRNGYRYDEVQVKDIEKRRRQPHTKTYFEEYTINIDLTEINDKDIDKQNKLSNHNMYKIRELYVEIDSLSGSFSKDIQVFADNMYFRSGATKLKDTTLTEKDFDRSVQDTLDEFLSIFNTRQQTEIVNLALKNARGTIQTVNSKQIEFHVKTKRLNKHEIALHEKYALAAACIILFFVGAPLGAIIRKGGMGLPMVVAIVLFLAYHFIGIFAKNSAEDGTMHPFIASWLSTVIMMPLGMWLTYRATTDQGIFDIDSFFQRFRKSRDPEVQVVYADLDDIKNVNEEQWLSLRNLDDTQLRRSVKNYRQYGHSNDYRLAALKVLEERGVTQEQLHVSGDLNNENYNLAENLIKKFKKESGITLLLYVLALIAPLLVFTISPESQKIMVVAGIVQLVLLIGFFFFLAKTHFTVKKFSDITGNESIIAIAILLGMPFYFILYFYYKKKMKADLTKIE